MEGLSYHDYLSHLMKRLGCFYLYLAIFKVQRRAGGVNNSLNCEDIDVISLLAYDLYFIWLPTVANRVLSQDRCIPV